MNSGSAKPRDWDAATYDRVSAPQAEWAVAVLDRLELRGDETVLDAGCGSGRVTRMLLVRLPRGRVIGVDSAPAMIGKAREAFRDEPRFEPILGDLLEIELVGAVDAVFSNATFHWITDHPALFARLHAALRPGGQLVAQCGGEGNVTGVLGVTARVASQPPFREHLRDWAPTWRFAGAEETTELLEDAGFDDVRCWLESRPAEIPAGDVRDYLRSVCLGPLVDRLPAEVGEALVDAVEAELPKPVILDYVRLNIDATRPA